MNPKVDEYLIVLEKWQAELMQLRRICLACGLKEEVKWGVPCYTFQQSNLLLLGNFKDYCVLSFVKGVLLSDAQQILVRQSENSQTGRIVKFTSVQEIIDLEPILKQYIFEAIEAEKAGIVFEKKPLELVLPEELLKIFEQNPAFETAFKALTPGRQRAYNMYFTAAKQSKTKTARIEQYMKRIFDGKGINDCTCGLSKKMPNCDGSHKYLVTSN